IYGVCDSYGRRSLWADLIHCAHRFKMSPWVMLGDFNVTRFGHEHSSSSRITKAMNEFNNMIRTAELEDLRTSGCKLTWSNLRKGRAAIAKNISDHSPISIQLLQSLRTSGRPFKFLKFWADHCDFIQIVKQEWVKTYPRLPLVVIHLKLKCLKGCLKRLSTRPDTLAYNLRQKLYRIQDQLDARPEDEELKNQEIILRQQLIQANKDEEGFYKQKSRIQWLKDGDANT
ncbi:hypothetical protein CFOL_v3_04825, partial [Cephalotus follicularis]